MKKTACFVVAAAIILLASSAAGQDCGPLNLQFQPDAPAVNPGDPLYDEWVPLIAEHFGLDPAGFGWCWTQRVVGTIPGTWVTCGGDDLFVPNPFGIGDGPDLYGNPGVLFNKRGEVYTMSWGLSRFDSEFNWLAFGGLTHYDGETGRYTDAEGWGTDRPKHYPPTYWIRSAGYFCYPEDDEAKPGTAKN